MPAAAVVAAEPYLLPPSSSITLVGRDAEREVLSSAMRRALTGKGGTWLLEGPAGIGKSRLAGWAEEEGEHLGFQVRWGRCMKEVLSPFFPWQQVFRGSGSATPGPRLPFLESSAAELPTTVLVDEAETSLVRERVAAWTSFAPVLLVTREPAAALRGRWPGLAGAHIVWLSRVEAEGSLSPVQVDALGRHLEEHFRAAPGSVVVLEAIEFLATQNSFSVLLNLLQWLTDVAQHSGGHLVVTGKAAAFGAREVALLETIGASRWKRVDPSGSAVPKEGMSIDTARPPSLVWLDYLDRLEAEAKARPQLVILDDLQWGDPASVSGFQFLARNLRSMAVLLLATARTDEVRAPEERSGSNVAAVLGAMDAEGILARLPLGGLSETDMLRIMNELLQAPLEAPEHRQELHAFVRRAGGNPYLALSTTRMLVEAGVLRRHHGRVHLALPPGEELPKVLPESVQSAVRRRLALIPPEDRSVLEIGAVQGQEFELIVVAEALGRPLAEIEKAARRLETTHRFVRPSGANATRVEFTHPLSWEGVISACEEEIRRAHALALADWWAERRPNDALEAARLYWEARELRKGLPWTAKAIETALGAQASSVAERCALWRLDLQERAGISPDLSAEEALRTARGLSGLGDQAAALRLCRRLSSLALSPGPSLARAVEELFILTVVDVKEARTAWEALSPRLEVAEEAELPEVRARAELAHAQLLGFEGRATEARSLAASALEMLQASSDPGLQARALYSWSFWSLALGETTGVRERLEEGLARSRAAGRVRDEAHLINGLARVQIEEGRLREAEASSGRSAECFHQAGNTTNEAMLLANRATLLIDLEEPGRALTVARQGYDISRRQGFPRGILVCQALMGHAMSEEGDIQEGLQLLEEGVAGLRERGFLFDSLEVASWLGAARSRAGRDVAALEFLASLEREVETAGLEAQVSYHRIRGSVLLSKGDLLGARVALETAVALLDKVGAWAEKARLFATLAELDAREGHIEAAQRDRTRANEVRAKIGLPPRPREDRQGGQKFSG